MNTRGHFIGAALLPAIVALAACGPQVRTTSNNALSLYQQGTSTSAVQAREDVASGAAKAIPNPSAAPSSAIPAAHDMSSMPPGMDMSAPASASPSASAAPAPSATPAPKAYDASLPPVPAGTVHQITLTAREGVQQIAPGVKYSVMTFDGTAPGPILHVKQGDTVEFTLKNEGTMQHSIDFHAAETPWNVNYKSINPGETLNFSFKDDHPGAFMYHCGTAPALMHIASGMYGAIVVDPATPLPAAKEYVLVQSEFYTGKPNAAGVSPADYPKMQNGAPDYVVFNGVANQYTGDNALTADPGLDYGQGS